MIKNFDELKKQLRDLAGIINGFKSEAVQLRIMELIFQGAPDYEDNEDLDEAKSPKRKRKGKKTASTRNPAAFEGKKKPTHSGKSGPATVLTQLIEEGFFKANRTLNAIMDHSGKKKARKFKPNELSGPLARFVRAHRLDRDKNKDGQYEYFKK
jgi:hypothetical protein